VAGPVDEYTNPYTPFLSDSLLFGSVWWSNSTVAGIECDGVIEGVGPVRQYCDTNIEDWKPYREL
jgi:hypothetical protein